MEESEQFDIRILFNLIDEGKPLIYPFRHEEWLIDVLYDVTGVFYDSKVS